MAINIKNYIKDKIPFVRKILYIKNKHRIERIIINNIGNYKKAYLKYSTNLPGEFDENSRRRIVIIDSHIIEKGLSHSNYRPGFGKKVVVELQDNLLIYKESQNTDTFAINNAISLLYKYHEMNREKGFDDSEYLDLTKFGNFAPEDLEPFEIYTDGSCNPTPFELIAKNRHSVRCYEEDGLEISDEIINKAINLANTAPSACNRQATHVFAVTDRDKYEAIEKIHGGCKGFGTHASMFLFVTSDLSLYSSNEVKLPVFDAGIYTMNLLYSLQAYGLYSCVLNATFPGATSNRIHEITVIPDNYEINGLIAVYNLKSDAVEKIAASPRRSAEEVLTFIG